jgi:hyaluronoglucosaminidase
VPVLRATVEGFYGPPWSHEERLEHLAFCARVGLDTYVYGPKDDPWHRAEWRAPYPPEELARLGALVAHADSVGVTFVYAIHPGLSMRWDDPADQEALHAKAGQLWDVGVRRFALFFDDIAYSTDPEADGAAHARVAARFAEGFLAPTAAAPLFVVPTDYAGTQESPYRTGFGRALPEHSLVFWTGPDIVVGAISDADVRAAHAAFGRPLALWDNFPVNDFDARRLFLGPLVDRPTAFEDGVLAGIMANPMIQPRASRLALATVAEYAADPASYDPAAAHARAVADQVPPELVPLVEVCSSWPPSASPAPWLEGLRGQDLVAALGPLAAMPDDLDHPLAAELRPWVLAGRAMARAGIAAARGDLGAARALLVESESYDADVLRSVLAPYVRSVLGLDVEAADPALSWVTAPGVPGDPAG